MSTQKSKVWARVRLWSAASLLGTVGASSCELALRDGLVVTTKTIFAGLLDPAQFNFDQFAEDILGRTPTETDTETGTDTDTETP